MIRPGRVLLAAAALAVAAFGADAALWRLAPANFRAIQIDARSPFFRRVALGGGRARWVPARPGSEARAFEDPKPAGTRRVFVIGGSVARPFARRGGELFAKLFAGAVPGEKLELVSCGMTAYDSGRDELVLQDAVRREPDLIVVLSGNNEYGHDLLPYPRLALLGLAKAAPVRDPRERAARFEANLRKMVRTAKGAGVPIVLCTLPANLRDSAPSRGGPVSLPLEDRGFFDAWKAWERGDGARAEKLFADYSRSHPGEPFSRFYRAKALERLGRRSEAAAAYRAAADLTEPGERTPPARNALIRRVAAEEGAALADLEREFEAASPGGVPGREMFRDPCHFHEGFYALASAAVLEAAGWGRPLAAARRQAAALARRGPPEDAFWQAAETALSKALLAPKDALWDEGVNGLSVVVESAPQVAARLLDADGALAHARESPWLGDLRGLDPREGRRAIMVHLGAAYRRAGRLEDALRAFERAEAERPGGYQAELGRAQTLARLGRTPQAREAFEALAREHPEKREPGYWLESLR